MSVISQSVPFVDLSAQYASIKDDVNAAMARVLSQSNFILGKEVNQFEEAFAGYCDTDFAVGVDSGTSALEIALLALDIGPGDEVITAANTFIATVLAISYCGATPVLVDADPVTYNLDPNLVEAAITPRTKAIIPVHLYGQPADMGAMMTLAERHNLWLIEDASQAHGSRFEGQRVGSMGHLGVFSLYPAKNLGAYGDAGIIVTKDEALAHKIRLLRNYGSTVKYHHDIRGFNRRLDTLHAAVLNVKLRHLDRWNACRRAVAAQYDDLLQDSPLITPAVADQVEPVYHLYVVRHPDRDGLQQFLREAAISTGIHYPVPIHLQPAYADLGHKEGDFPVTEKLAGEILSLPMYPELPTAAIQRTVATISDFFK